MALPPKITDDEFVAAMEQWKMCGKVGFETESKAQRRALALGYTYYECPHCHKFHLTKRGKINVQNIDPRILKLAEELEAYGPIAPKPLQQGSPFPPLEPGDTLCADPNCRVRKSVHDVLLDGHHFQESWY